MIELIPKGHNPPMNEIKALRKECLDKPYIDYLDKNNFINNFMSELDFFIKIKDNKIIGFCNYMIEESNWYYNYMDFFEMLADWREITIKGNKTERKNVEKRIQNVYKRKMDFEPRNTHLSIDEIAPCNYNNIILGEICILPKYQNNGLGSELMKESLKQFNQHDRIYTFVEQNNKSSRHLMEKFGFVDTLMLGPLDSGAYDSLYIYTIK